VRKLLLQLDSSPHPSVFDQVVAYDAGADVVLSYGGVTPATVRELVRGCIFTRGPRDLRNTAIFIGGTDMAAGEALLAAVCETFFGPMRVSVMLDSNGSNTTAVAAVRKLEKAVGGVKGGKAVITAGTGPVGVRAAGLLASRGAGVVLTSRRLAHAEEVAAQTSERFGGSVTAVEMKDAAGAPKVLDGAQILLNAGGAGICLVKKAAWAGRGSLKALADVNAVPPLGIEGVEVTDNGTDRDGVAVFGALGVGGLKMKIHKASIARLFEQNDLVLDSAEIDAVAGEIA
jgi:methylenetetrahydrofolate/methylenetetrahydromethanopterin dehydrogenase (NADP+)